MSGDTTLEMNAAQQMLLVGAQRGDETRVRAALQTGGDPSAPVTSSGFTPLMAAAKAGNAGAFTAAPARSAPPRSSACNPAPS